MDGVTVTAQRATVFREKDPDGCTIVRWPDNYVVVLPRAELGEDPTLHEVLVRYATEVRALVEGPQ